MTELVQALLEQHRTTLDRLEQGEADDIFLDDVLALLDDLRLAGEVVTDPAERAQLRALIHFWSGTVFDYTGNYPTVALLPADVGAEEASSTAPARSAPPLLWLLAGGASVAVIAAALVIIGSMAQGYDAGPAAAPAPAAAPRVRYVLAEEGLGGSSAPVARSMAFCRGASDLVFHFGLADFQPDMDLRWKLRREGIELTTRPAVPYGEQNESLTVRIGADESGGFQPGQYDLLLLAAEENVWVETFEVLGVAPRAFGLHVSDVPAPPDAGDGRREFEPGVRVLYLRFAYEGLCSGLELSHELHLGGELVQRLDQVWQGQPQGEARAVFQVTGGTVFAPGVYEIVTTIAGKEQARVEFMIRG